MTNAVAHHIPPGTACYGGRSACPVIIVSDDGDQVFFKYWRRPSSTDPRDDAHYSRCFHMRKAVFYYRPWYECNLPEDPGTVLRLFPVQSSTRMR